jgi:D-beta-D-heptose 7-phosphate kinase/D-beta-D-heptose 1-phosphate adenosyltransferase
MGRRFAEYKNAMKKIWINGSFDILHIGHIRLISYAASLGDLRMGMDSDERISEKKGTSRPFNSLYDRMEFASRIVGVNSVVHFANDSELTDRIREWEPDVMVIGSDYKGKKIIGAEHIKEIIYYPRSSYSTTGLVEKIITEHEKNISGRRVWY